MARRPDRSTSYLVMVAGIAALYFATAKLGLALTVAYETATPVWLPTGIAIGAVLIFGYRMWPGIALGAFFANYTLGVELPAAGAIAVGNTLEAVIGVWLLRRVAGFDERLQRIRDVTAFLFIATLAPVISASVGVTATLVSGGITRGGFPYAWGLWWFGDVLSAVVVVPVLLAWANTNWREEFSRRWRVVENLLFLGVTAGAAWAVFFVPRFAYPGLLAPLWAWGAIRFRQRGVAETTLVILGFAIAGVLTRSFGLPAVSLTEAVITTSIVVVALGASALLLAATLSEREAARDETTRRTRSVRLLERIAVAANEASTVDAALESAVDAVCSYTGWPIGHVYLPSATNPDLLVPSPIWRLADSEKFSTFKEITEQMPLVRGRGLPGRVLANGEPAWITDVRVDPNFPRASAARAIGIRGAFGFPILIGREVVGVLEFFSEEHEEPDEPLLELMGNIGTQLGRVVERKRSREALESSEERARLIVETATDAFIAIDRASRVLEWNEVAEKVFGWSRDEIIGASMPETLMPERYREAHFKGIARYFDTGEAPVLFQTVEVAALHRDGHEIPIELTIWPIKTGSAQQFNAFVRDVSERKRLEAFREHFIANAAHELRTPVATMGGIIELLTEHDLESEEESRSLLDSLKRQGKRINSLINDLLDLTRLERGALQVDLQPVLLSRIVANAIEGAPAPEDKNVTVKVGRKHMVVADPRRLEQIVTNLLSNAYRYGGETIEIRSSIEDSRVELIVEDNGTGVPDELLPELFEPFSRGANATGAGGSGLGLAIVKMLAEVCDGKIHYEPGDPYGARFVLRLPAA
jgi:PAS domain S-box-containing protein